MNGHYIKTKINIRKAERFFLSLFMFFFLSSNFSIFAQSNPYGIKDNLYTYWLQINTNIKKEKAINMADTLFNMAKDAHDKKAQCMALIIKPLHYFFTDNLHMLIKSKKEISGFILNTPYLQYYFDPWNRLINYYTNHKMYGKALEEMKEYQKEALRLNNNYGISHGFRKMGDIYTALGNTDLAIGEYLKAIDFAKRRNSMQNLDDVYLSLAKCYSDLHKYDEARNLLNEYMQTKPNFSQSNNTNILLLHIYLQEGTNKKAIEHYKNYVLKTINPARLTGSSYESFMYTMCDYYIFKKEYRTALQYATSDGRKSEIYAAMNDFKNALTFKNNQQKEEEDKHLSLTNEMAVALATESNLSLLEMERKTLELNNAHMKVQQLQAHEKIMKMEEDHNKLELYNKQLALERQQAVTDKALASAEKEKTQAQQQKDKALLLETESEYRNNMLMLSYFVIVVIVITSALMLYRRRIYNKRLKEEYTIAQSSRKIAEQALNEAKIEKANAEKADKLKSLFLQNMSHEIRTPLNAIIGFNDILNSNLKNYAITEQEKKNFLEIIHTNSDLLLTLVNDILDLSKLESGNYKVNLTSAYVKDICEFSLKSISSRIPQGVTTKLEMAKEDEKLAITTDVQCLQQLLFNYLTNACKYTEKGSITLSYKYLPLNTDEYSREYPSVRFTVTDTGIGIPEEMSEKIFQRFEKLDNFKQGTGLGLNICQHIASLLDGHVYLDKDYKNGSRFVFVHPIK